MNEKEKKLFFRKSYQLSRVWLSTFVFIPRRVKKLFFFLEKNKKKDNNTIGGERKKCESSPSRWYKRLWNMLSIINNSLLWGRYIKRF